MAFNARKIFPNDLKPRVAVGFNLPINGPAVFISNYCLLYTSPSPRDRQKSRMPSSA